MLRQRVLLDSLESYPGHAFDDWWEKFHETHPEYFALQPNGTRDLFPRSNNPNRVGRAVKLCHSNPGVLEQWFQTNVIEELERNPNLRVFNASTNDGWNAGHCICEDCRAWDHPDGEPRSFSWQGISQQYVALSDREVTFANKCARLLKERFPDKDYYVAFMAYGHSRPAPIEARPDDNVMVISVANFLGRTGMVDRGSSRGDTYREQFDAWARLEPRPNLVWRPNTGSPAGWQQGLLDVSMTQTIEDFEHVADAGAIGVIIDSTWEHWATQGPMYYVMAQMIWDTSLDGHAVLEDYYRRAFGPAADTMAEYWQYIEETRQHFVAGDHTYPDVYNAAFFEKADRYIEQARQQLTDAPQRYRDRVDFVATGLEHQRLYVAARELQARHDAATGKQKEAIAQKWREAYEQIEANAHKYEHAINWGPIRPRTGRIPHPDH